MMGFRQVYKAAGLEHYQDKIQLSKDQRKLLTVRALELIIYTENYRGMKPHSVCSLRCSYCPGYTESYFRQSCEWKHQLAGCGCHCKDFQQRGFRVPEVFFASYDEDFDVRPTLRDLESQRRPYVAKASHLCCAQGVFVMEAGLDRSLTYRFSGSIYLSRVFFWFWLTCSGPWLMAFLRGHLTLQV